MTLALTPEELRDPDDFEDLPARDLLARPLERAAIATHRLTMATPEDVGILLARDDPGLVKTWKGGPGFGRAERNFWRRRAALTIQAYEGTFREH